MYSKEQWDGHMAYARSLGVTMSVRDRSLKGGG